MRIPTFAIGIFLVIFFPRCNVTLGTNDDFIVRKSKLTIHLFEGRFWLELYWGHDEGLRVKRDSMDLNGFELRNVNFILRQQSTSVAQWTSAYIINKLIYY